jgi:RimJ/RimL family protein N-acetyltransferase
MNAFTVELYGVVNHFYRGLGMARQPAARKTVRDLDLARGAMTVLRPLADGDLPQLEAWDQDPEISDLMGRQFAQESAADWYCRVRADRSYRLYAIETPEGRLIGDIVLAGIDWRGRTAEVRICIGDKDLWGNGYGTDAMKSVLRLAFDSWNLGTVYLRVFLSNERAIRSYARCGFRRAALLNASSRRNDPGGVLLMVLTRERWQRLSRSA